MRDKILFISIGFGTGVLFWILEAIIHVFVFHEGTFFKQMFTPALHEIWMRLVSMCIIILFSVFAQVFINKHRQAEAKTKLAYTELNQIFNTAADGMRLIGRNFTVLRINETFLTLLGMSRDEVVGKKCYEMFHGPFCHTPGCSMNRILAGEERFVHEAERETNDGTSISCILTATPFRAPDGELIGIVENFKDISERKEAEKTLRKTKDYLNNVIESSLDGIVVSDEKGYIIKANKSLLKLIGHDADELAGMFVSELSVTKEGVYESTAGESIEVDEKFSNEAKTKITLLLEEGTISNWKTHLTDKNNKLIPVEMNISFLLDKDRNRIGAVGIIRDITERIQAEREAKKSAEKYRSLIENAADAIISTNEKGTIIDFNKKAEALFGYTRKEIMGKPVTLLSPLEDREREIKALKAFKTTRKLSVSGKTVAMKGLRKGGQKIPLEGTFYDLELQGEYIFTSIMRDLSEREKAEKEIRETKEFLENVIKSSMDGILITDEMGTIISLNNAIEKMTCFKKEELIGKHASLLAVDDKEIKKIILEKTAELFEKGSCFFEAKQKTKDGRIINVECNCSMIKDDGGNHIGGVTAIRDITERRKLEQQLIQSEKLKSLGELAGGVAHDFNNCLAAILGRAQLLKMDLEAPPEMKEKQKTILELKGSLEIIEQAARDGAETVRRIQEFARRRADDKNFTEVAINELINQSLEFTEVKWKNESEEKGIKIDIQKELSPLPFTTGCASELREVFTNLINNAVDAMPQGGQIKIKTLKEDGTISIKVEDTGVGIPETITGRIFDPFFTTKGLQSTGLGMSVSYGIISRHQGTIKVASIEGQGTALTIRLPISDKTINEGKRKTVPEEQRKASILVIEDEEVVRDLLFTILTSAGHEVESTSNGEQGIELFKKKEFDLVFTDLGMPGMSGWQVAEKIKSINGRVPVAVITGWNIEMDESELKKKWIDLIIHKPFEVSQTLRLVQEGMMLRDRFKAA